VRAPAFWWRRPGPLSLLLAPLGAVYGSIVAGRMAAPAPPRPPVPVVCIGNFVVGGAGKTPTAIAAGLIALRAGLRPCFLIRGYGGRLRGPLLVDPERHSAADVGDEALLLARVAPTVVSRDRSRGLPLIAGIGFDLVLMDDGFQNPTVPKTMSLVVVDGQVGVGTGRPMPAGPLRAPLAVQLPLADAVVVLGEGPAAGAIVRAAARAAKPVLRARLDQKGVEAFRGQRVYAYAGIGRPEKFFGQLAAAGVTVVETRAFPDHHPYTGLEAREIMTRADALDALPVTTEKDAVRLAHAAAGPRAELASRSIAFAVDCIFEAPDQVAALLRTARERWLAEG
jgi:tetraacyldisaccharide 4'-kinase